MEEDERGEEAEGGNPQEREEEEGRAPVLRKVR